jgi:5'-3' exonuclease
MGVKGLYTYLRPYRHELDIGSIPSKSVLGVDALSLLYKFRANTEMILKFLEPFQRLECKILFVFDGKAPDTKNEEKALRRAKREVAQAEAAILRNYLKLAETVETLDEKGRKLIERKIYALENGEGWYLTQEARHAFQDIIRKNGMHFVKAKGEADDVLMSLWSDRRLHAIISADMDFLVAGVERLWIPSIDKCEEVLLSSVLEEEGLEMGSFRDAAILCGVSPIYVFLNMYPKKAFAFMRHYGSLEILANMQQKKFKFINPELLTEIRSRFLLFVKAEEMVIEDYREIIIQL